MLGSQSIYKTWGPRNQGLNASRACAKSRLLQLVSLIFVLRVECWASPYFVREGELVIIRSQGPNMVDHSFTIACKTRWHRWCAILLRFIRFTLNKWRCWTWKNLFIARSAAFLNIKVLVCLYILKCTLCAWAIAYKTALLRAASICSWSFCTSFSTWLQTIIAFLHECISHHLVLTKQTSSVMTYVDILAWLFAKISFLNIFCIFGFACLTGIKWRVSFLKGAELRCDYWPCSIMNFPTFSVNC